MVNKNFVQRKITLIDEELVGLEKLGQYSLEEVASDFIKLSATERILERIVVRAIDINEHLIAELAVKETKTPLSYGETFLRLVDFKVYPEEFAQSILKSVKTRNKLVYDYDKLDAGQIYSSIKECLDDYYKYGEYILQFLDKKI
ncbi:MAG: DUF86 domain-containing protein [Patescibacteria group bacterium]